MVWNKGAPSSLTWLAMHCICVAPKPCQHNSSGPPPTKWPTAWSTAVSTGRTTKGHQLSALLHKRVLQGCLGLPSEQHGPLIKGDLLSGGCARHKPHDLCSGWCCRWAFTGWSCRRWRHRTTLMWRPSWTLGSVGADVSTWSSGPATQTASIPGKATWSGLAATSSSRPSNPWMGRHIYKVPQRVGQGLIAKTMASLDDVQPMVFMLPSNASQALFLENTATDYRTELPSCMVLNSNEYKVALVNLSRPGKTWYNLPKVTDDNGNSQSEHRLYSFKCNFLPISFLTRGTNFEWFQLKSY